MSGMWDIGPIGVQWACLLVYDWTGQAVPAIKLG